MGTTTHIFRFPIVQGETRVLLISQRKTGGKSGFLWHFLNYGNIEHNPGNETIG